MKMTRTRKIFGTLLITALTVFTACEKEFDTVPVKVLPEGNIITIDSLRNIYTAYDTTITGDYSVYGVVTADAVTGNIYKELYIQDETNAIKLELLSSADFFIGDRVRVAIKGATIRRDRDMLVLDSINPDIAIIKQEANQDLTPELVTIADINEIDVFASRYQGKLVQINNVEFECADVCNTWAEAIGQSDENRNLIDTMGNTIVVRSSGFSSFAGERLPFGNGSIIGVVSQYDGTVQITIRNPNEFIMSGSRNSVCAPCPEYILNKNFNDNSLTSSGWVTKHVSGIAGTEWGIFSGSNSAATISNYAGSAVASESWLISSPIDLSATTNPVFSFQNVVNYSLTPQIQVLVSTDYDGTSAPNTATWIDMTSSATLDTDDSTFNSWTSSGNISLTPYKQSNVYLAFKLIGTTAASSTWEIDDVIVQDI